MKKTISDMFNSPMYFEPWEFGYMGELVGTLRYLPNGGTANDTQQLNPTIEYYFQPWDLGFLLFDLRTHDRQDLPVAELLIHLADDKLTIIDAKVSVALVGRGLMAYLLSVAQNATDWQYPLIGVERITEW